jgi:twitching motility protein PilT
MTDASRPQAPNVVNMDALLQRVVQVGGSDLHLSAGLPPGVRVHGDIVPIREAGVLSGEAIAEMVSTMLNDKQRALFAENLELDTSHTVRGVGRFRLNVFQQRGAIGAVMRVIPFQIPEFASLGLPRAVAGLATLNRGLVLVTGPTGSGKSTTLASLIDIINTTRAGHIMTVEDPIEFLHPHKGCVVNQREVGEDTRSFADALKHVLRQDPDVILVGEMRDLETMSTALTAAETGHLVFGTLHTQSAPQSVDRIIDVFPAHQQQQVRSQLANALQAVVTQQLVPGINGGRVAAAEVLIVTSAVRNLIREAKTHQVASAMQAGGQHGMQTMDRGLADLVRARAVTMDAALERAHNPEDLRRLISGS